MRECYKNKYLYTNVNKYIWMRIMQSKNITLRVNSELYDQYKNFCKNKGWLISRQFEIMMEKHMKKEK